MPGRVTDTPPFVYSRHMSQSPHRGSRLDLLLFLDSAHYPAALDSALAAAGTRLLPGDPHYPLGARDDRELELPRFSRLHLSALLDPAALEPPAWWLAKAGARTPSWDLIATSSIDGRPGLLLVEAKAHHGELETAGKPFGRDSNPANQEKIGESLQLANSALNSICPGFQLGRDSYYQVSNRAAWAWRVASLGLPVTLLYLGFLQDPHWPADPFSSPADWHRAASEYLGHVIPAAALHRRLPCSAAGSLCVTIASLPALPAD